MRFCGHHGRREPRDPSRRPRRNGLARPGARHGGRPASHPSRRALLGALADARPRAVDVLAALTGMPSTLAGKHLILLRKAGLIEAVAPPDGDGRKSFYRLPPDRITRDAAGTPVLDFGCVLLRLAPSPAP